MRIAISFTLLVVLLFTTQTGLAGTAKSSGDKNKKPIQSSPATVVKASDISTTVTRAPEQVTQLRWNVQTDAAVNETRLRLVLDVSGSIEMKGEVVPNASTNPSLVVELKGALPVGIASQVDLDGNFAKNISISTDGKDSKLKINLAFMAGNSDCRVFAIPADSSNNKPFRVIIDICEPAPAPGWNIAPGLKNKVIVIDPGHGGSDPGAVGPAGTFEKTIAFAVAKKIETLLGNAGAKVVLTRQDDQDVFGPDSSAAEELQARVDVAEWNQADLFLSIHANAAFNPLSNGTGTYYYRKTTYDALLAQNLQSAMVKAGGRRDRSFFPANFYVVKRTSMPAALVELAFLSNAQEEDILNDPQFQQKMAQGIAQGVEQFFEQAAKR